MKKSEVKFFGLLLAGAFLFLLSSCEGSRSLFTKNLEEEIIPLHRVVVFPYTVVRPPQGEVMVRSPIGGDMFRTGEVNPDAQDVMTELLMNKLKGRNEFFATGRAAVESFLGKTIEDEPYSFGPVQVLKLGRKFDADGVLIGFIYVFRDRVGSGFAVSTPASVSFDLYLLEAQTGRVLWKAGYTRTQQPMSDNLFDIEEYMHGGIKWMTAKELADLGIKKMFEQFPVLTKEEK